MNAVILVAGVARRMAPLTDTTHKALLPVGGRPVLTRMLEALDAAGVRQATLVVGHCADQVRKVAGERVGRLAVRYIHNPEYTRGDRVIALGKKVVPEAWDAVGEGVGFFKCGAEAAPELLRGLAKVIEESHGLGEWEDAIHLLAPQRHVGWVDVTGMPWTEIDFVEDLRRAETDVLPRVVRHDGA